MLKKLFDPSRRALKSLNQFADQVLAFDGTFKDLKDADFKTQTDNFKSRMQNGESIEALEKELTNVPFRVKKIPLKSMTSQEAITALKMINHDFYIFKDADNNQIYIAYLRHDSNYDIIVTE